MASSARREQCTFTWGSPSRASMTALFVTCRASWTLLPLTISVAMLLVATAAPHPKVLNLQSCMMPSSSMSRYILIMSPHLAFPTVPTPSASSISPTFLGFVKWSITFSLYSPSYILMPPASSSAP